MGFTFRDGDGNEIKQGITNMPTTHETGYEHIYKPTDLPASTYEDIINRLREENKKLKENIEILKKMI